MSNPAQQPVVLCVDDEQEILEILRRGLAKEDCRVVTVADPSKALAVAGQESPDLIISDLQMPGVSGLELLDLFRQLHPTTIRMLMTGRGTLDAAIAAINSNQVFRYIKKPFNVVAVRELVREALDRRSQLADRARADRDIERRAAIVRDLEARYPGISTVPRDGPLQVHGGCRLARTLALGDLH